MPVKIDDATASEKTLLLFCLLLFSGKSYTLTELSTMLQCAKGTIMRLVRTIELSGVAEISTGITKGQRWYQLKTLPGTPHIGLTEDEVAKLALCRDLLERLLPEGIEKVISDSINKISTLIQQPEKRATATSTKAMRITRGFIDYSAYQPIINQLLQAITQKTVCHITYQTPNKRGERLFHIVPARLTVEDDILNMEGWSITDSPVPEVRFPTTLAIHRMKQCEVSSIQFASAPPLPEQRGAFGLLGRESFPVRVAFDAFTATYVKERIWSEDQQIIPRKDGGIELLFSAADEYYVMEWILGFGSGAEVLEPQSIRDQICEEIEALWEMYGPEEKEDDCSP